MAVRDPGSILFTVPLQQNQTVNLKRDELQTKTQTWTELLTTGKPTVVTEITRNSVTNATKIHPNSF